MRSSHVLLKQLGSRQVSKEKDLKELLVFRDLDCATAPKHLCYSACAGKDEKASLSCKNSDAKFHEAKLPYKMRSRGFWVGPSDQGCS